MDHASPFRRACLTCPRCRTSLGESEPSFCPRCQGAWISEQALVERIETMQQAPADLAWTVASREPLPCASCHAAMEPLVVLEAPIDRCRSHGFWFDRDELQQLLHASSQRRAAPASTQASSGVGIADAGGLAEVGIALVAEAPVAAASGGVLAVVADVAAGTAEVAAHVAVAIVEAIAELIAGLL